MYRCNDTKEVQAVSLALVEFLVLAGILAAIAFWGIRRVDPTDAANWAQKYGLVLSAPSVRKIERYLGWTRRWRMAGAFLGVLAFGKWILLDRMDYPRPGIAPWLILAVAGYLAGAMLAEITIHGMHGVEQPEVSAASLRERRPDMYVSKSAITVLWSVPVLCIALLLAYFLVADQGHIDSRVGIVAAAAFGGLALAMVVRRLMLHVVLRPQPAMSDELQQVDNAMRSWSLHAIVGSAVALALILLSVATSELQSALEARYQHSRVDLISIVTLGSLAVAAVSWFIFSRPHPAQARLEPIPGGNR
jgi:hypothetical protein